MSTATKSDYTSRVMLYPAEAVAIGRLRYEVFAKRLHWVTGDPITGLELNHLDDGACHLGVFDDKPNVVGYVRLIRGGGTSGMLLQQLEFAQLLSAQLDLGPTTAEVSRLCLRPAILGVGASATDRVLHLLFRGTYDWAVANGITTLYATVNDTAGGYLNKSVLERLLLFVPVSAPCQFAPGIDTYLMVLDLPAASRNPKFRAFLEL